ncbi:unnamed protein product, partial [Rotaria magnacalcarata]
LGQEVDETALSNPIAALAALSRENNNPINEINTSSSASSSTTNPIANRELITNPTSIENLNQEKSLPVIESLSKESVDRFT